MPLKIKKFRMTRAIERRRNREYCERLRERSVILYVVADPSELGPQPVGPVAWSDAAHQAFHDEYGRYRRWPCTELYPHHVVAKCLTAVWRAQGLPLVQFTSIETRAWGIAHYRGCETVPLGIPGGWKERRKIIMTAAFEAALAAYHGHRVTPFVTREALRARRRAERVAAVQEREERAITAAAKAPKS